MAVDRLSRFGDGQPLAPLCQIGQLSGYRPFFAGTDADNRMDLVREAINYIRTNWSRYPQFMHELRGFMAELEPWENDAIEQRQRLEELFASTKDWRDPQDRRTSPDIADYTAIRLYASQYGYRKIFSIINTAFRSDGLVTDLTTLRCATFLVELLTIDLYNFVSSYHAVENFEGRIYRGMCVSDESLQMFKRTARGPITERYLSIPLAMISASSDRAKALEFATQQAARSPGAHPLLWDITVSSLAPELLTGYRSQFPASVVTSLCAVPIAPLSDYPEEEEVLLRGPYFQIIRLARDETREVPDLHVIEAVMLNSNRDHISAIASNTGTDRAAREYFRTIISACRASICAGRADAIGLAADADAYRAIAAQAHWSLRSEFH